MRLSGTIASKARGPTHLWSFSPNGCFWYRRCAVRYSLFPDLRATPGGGQSFSALPRTSRGRLFLRHLLSISSTNASSAFPAQHSFRPLHRGPAYEREV